MSIHDTWRPAARSDIGNDYEYGSIELYEYRKPKMDYEDALNAHVGTFCTLSYS